MTITRVNPDTGIIEEQSGIIESFFDLWTPKQD